jgi:hypothetical protein
MSGSKLTRRSFVQTGLASLLAARAAFAGESASSFDRVTELEVTLEGRATTLGRELVSFGLPLPPGFLSDPKRVRLVDDARQELTAAVRPLEPWRIGGKQGSIRSLLIQFTLDFSQQRTQRIKIVFRPRRKDKTDFVSVEKTLIDSNGLEGPRILALLPAGWLCDSLIVGPQTPASQSGEYRAYDQFVEKNFPGSLAYLNSKVYSEWLFDRTTVYYKMFVRTGDAKFLEAAYHSAHFVRLHTKMDGPDAGIFTLKGPDLKYVYPRAMHIHYLLTGDERMLEAGKVMSAYCLKHQDPVYEPSSISASPIGSDPERGRKFWTLRHQGYGLLGVLHGWELTGDRAYWTKARECVDAYHKHQQKPPDGRPPDGSLRQDWALYDPSEATFKGATSAWMMALLLDPLFYYWTLTSDPRVPEIVTKWCDFLDRQGMVPDGTKAYYVINCFAAQDPKAPPGELGPDMEMHNPEIAYTFALGSFFTKDPKRRAIYRRRFDKLFPLAVKLDVNRPARAFNWAFQFSSQLVFFMNNL